MVGLRIKTGARLDADPEKSDASKKPEGSEPPTPAAEAAPAVASWEALPRPVFSTRTRLIAGAALGALCLTALLCFWQGAAISLLAALVFSSVLMPAIRWLGGKKIPFLCALPLLYGLAILGLALILLVWLPAGQRQVQTYGQHLAELTKRWTATTAALTPAVAPAAESATATPGTPAGTTNAAPTVAAAAAAADAEALAGLAKETVHAQVAKGAQQAAVFTKRLERLTEVSMAQTTRAVGKVSGQRWSMFFQLVVFTAGFLAIPLLGPREKAVTPGVWGRLGALVVAGYSRASIRLSVLCGTRMLQAAALALLSAIGLMLAGLDVAWFLSGCIAIFSLGLRCGPSLGMVLALPMIPLAPSWPLALGAVAVLWMALIMAEKKLYWYLQYLPALKAGWVPPPAGGSGLFGRLFGRLAGLLVRGLFSLALLLALAGFLYCMVPPYLADQERDEALNQAAVVYNAHNTVDAIANYVRVLQKYPNERSLLLGLARSYADAGDATNALALADRAVNGQARPPPEPTVQMRVYNVVMSFRAKPQLLVNPLELYEYVARKLLESGREFPLPPVASELGERLLQRDAKNAWGHLLLAVALVQEQKYPEAIQHVQQGLAAKNSEAEKSLQLFLARAVAEQKAPPTPPDKP